MSEESKSFQNWKDIGNKHFELGKYEDALQAYSQGLKETPDEINLLSNRGATYLKLELYENALTDFESVLLLEPLHFKSIYRKSRALCNLEKFHEAEEFVTAALPNVQDEINKRLLRQILRRIESLIQQKDQGNYDMSSFMKNPGVNFDDVATYMGPVIVSKTRLSFDGRGMLAIEEIKPGQIIIAQKAFAVEFKATDCNKFAENVEARLKSHPELIKDVYKLYAGPKLGKIEDECKLAEISKSGKTDMERIRGICKYNCFGGAIRPQVTVTCNPLETLGLWILPSYLNHDCVDCNSSWKIFGNVIFIRATKTIRCGEEILISYCDSAASYQDRVTVLRNFDFHCKCRLCNVETNEKVSIAQERKKLLDEFNCLMETSFAKLPLKEFAGLEDIISRIEDLRSEKDLNFFLATPLAVLGFQYQENTNGQRAVMILEKGYNYVKDLPLGDTCILFASGVIIAYLQDGIFDLAAQWLDILKRELRIAYGSDGIDIMECIDPELASGLKAEGLSF